MKGMINQKMAGIKTYQVKDRSQIAISDSQKGENRHFVTDFGYQFVMIKNEDPYGSLEVTSTINRNCRGYKILCPQENQKQYKLIVQPNESKIIAIQNHYSQAKYSFPYKIRVLLPLQELIRECE